MGLDQHIIMAKNRKVLDMEGFWNEVYDYSDMDEDTEIKFDKPVIVFCQRKNWDLHRKIWDKHRKELDEGQNDNGTYIQLDRDDLELILNFMTHNRDYFDGFRAVPSLCELLQRYDEIRENGFQLFYEGDY